MKHLYQALCGALLVIGLANIVPTAASAGTYYDSVCNCRRPDSQYNSRRYVRAPTRVNTHVRYVNHTNVVRRTRLIQENRLIVHVRPVINRTVVVHRQNTIVRNITLHRVNTTTRVQNVNRSEHVSRYVRGWTRHVSEWREVRGVNCNCGGSHHKAQQVSYRN